MKHFIYTGEVNLTFAIHALSTYVAARKYLIPELTKECTKYIQEKIKPSEVLEFYEYCETHNIPEFDELCFEIIEKKTDEVVNSKYFPTAKIGTMQLILKSQSLKLKSEIEGFNLFEKWALAEAARKQIGEGELASGFKTPKKCIRFLTISLEEFRSRIEQSLLLTQAVKRAIECNLLELDSKPMPENLSIIQQHRRFLSISRASEQYQFSHMFGISLDSFCEYCSDKWLGKLRITIIKVDHKYIRCSVQALDSSTSFKCSIFKIQSKVSVFALNECDDLIFKNESKFVQRGGRANQRGSCLGVSVANIPIDKLGDKFFSRGRNRSVKIDVQCNFVEEIINNCTCIP